MRAELGAQKLCDMMQPKDALHYKSSAIVSFAIRKSTAKLLQLKMKVLFLCECELM